MRKVLIQFAHPAIARSKINRALRSSVEGLEGVTVNDLYSTTDAKEGGNAFLEKRRPQWQGC